MPNNGIQRKDLVYPELSYTVIGILFNVYNELGPGHKEKYYQAAVALAFKEANVPFLEQVYAPLVFKEKKVGKYYLDFLVEDKVVLELKAGDKFLKTNISQVYGYLKAKGLKLGIIANFTKEGLEFKRILNVNPVTTGLRPWHWGYSLRVLRPFIHGLTPVAFW